MRTLWNGTSTQPVWLFFFFGLLGGAVDGYPSFAAYGYAKNGGVVKLFEEPETTDDKLLPPLDVKLSPLTPTKP